MFKVFLRNFLIAGIPSAVICGIYESLEHGWSVEIIDGVVFGLAIGLLFAARNLLNKNPIRFPKQFGPRVISNLPQRIIVHYQENIWFIWGLFFLVVVLVITRAIKVKTNIPVLLGIMIVVALVLAFYSRKQIHIFDKEEGKLTSYWEGMFNTSIGKYQQGFFLDSIQRIVIIENQSRYLNRFTLNFEFKHGGNWRVPAAGLSLQECRNMADTLRDFLELKEKVILPN